MKYFIYLITLFIPLFSLADCQIFCSTKLGSVFTTFPKLKEYYPQWYFSSDRTTSNSFPWPAGFDPEKSYVFAHNEIYIPKSPDIVFAKLQDAVNWPNFYVNAANVKVADSRSLHIGSKFTWSTFGVMQKSTVILFEQNRYLGWSAGSIGTQAFHRFLLFPQGSGTFVVTEECQNGATEYFLKSRMNPGLHAAHQLWLESLKKALTE